MAFLTGFAPMILLRERQACCQDYAIRAKNSPILAVGVFGKQIGAFCE
jgi:hypothetical protein